ncbi:MAG: PP2C family protein-serine/threonine phosphatase, partial [candidate division Zixibacteria bacterium]|nr:PP2C family protein-serine/threonine phosphatase [candidate division Zixibacteria bacterium]
DLYDVFEVGPQRYCLVVADVSGKGVPASLVMSMLRTVIQINSLQATSSRDTLIKVNEYLKINMPAGMFITVMLGVYDASAREIDLVSAGHNPMLFYRAITGEVRQVNPSGMPLGLPVTLDREFEESLEPVTLKIDNGDLFFIFTDGITEAMDHEGQQFGIERLVDFLSKNASMDGNRDVSTLARDIIAEVDEYAGFTKQNDDITFLIARAVSNDTTDIDTSEPMTDHVTLETTNDSETMETGGT